MSNAASSKAQRVAFILLVFSINPLANSQWLNYPTPGIPRTKAGKPDLSAPVPKLAAGIPDLSGIWGRGGNPPEVPDSQLTVQGLAAVERFRATASNNKDTNLAKCLPHFLTQVVPLSLYKIVQSGDLIVILQDGQGMPLPRQIFVDGRPLPDSPNPSWMGYSVGNWEGDMLVVETIGFNNRGLVPGATGIPMTETTRITERFERIDFGHMKLQIVFEDPQTLNKPWTFNLTPQLQADTELLEFVCEKNGEILQHMVDAR
jgi:hypothetical protein